MNNWTFKTNCKGEPTTSVERRMKKLETTDLSTHEGRTEFGYCYLEYIVGNE